MAIHPGDILAGYRVTRLLGRGGMGEVWAATHEADHRDVAIKILLARAAMKPDLVKRFEREARIASAIKSPYVCKLIDVAHTDDRAHLLVFEHLLGESLADRLKREQYLPFSEVGPILDDVLQGLVAAHAAGVIHRDLKPGNIFLEQLTPPGPDDPSGPHSVAEGALGQGMVLGKPRRSGSATEGEGDGGEQQERRERAMILDFGISKLTRREKEEPTLTAFDATLGSFAYMAPEQVRGAARADERADIYAIGAVAFRSLSGRLPFEGTTAAVLVSMKLDRSAPSLAEATGERWPSGVERFLERALDRKRERRFASASEALAAWRAIQLSTITRSRRPTRRPSAPAFPAVGAPPPAPSPSPPPAQASPGSASGRTPMPASSRPREVPAAPTFGPPPPLPPAPPRWPVPGIPLAPRAPMISELPVEDHPTEVDEPPTMTVDGSYQGLDPRETRARKTGRP